MQKPNATDKQKLAFRYARNNPYSIIAMDPRLGKTRVAIGIQKKFNLNCLVICPGYLVSNWPKEIRKWHNKDVQITQFTRGKDLYEPCDSDFVIISYDMVKKAEHLFEWASMVVLDEGHHLKSMAAQKTSFIHRCIYEYSIKRVHILTGTILKNRVREFFSPLSMMYYDPRLPDKVEFNERFTNEIDFADHFSYRTEFNVKVTTKRGAQFMMPVARWEGLKNVKELKKYLKGRYIRIKADSKDLPPVVEQTILISDSPNQKLLDAFKAFFDQDGAGSVKPDIKVAAAIQKIPFTIKYVEDLMENVECALLYSDHVPVIEELAKHFGVPAITGKMPAKKRSALADEFQAGKGKLICATIGSLKEGKDLFRAKDIVLNDICWVPGDLKQVVDRVRALGQKETRTVHKIFGSPQDEKIDAALKEKMAVIEAAT